MKIYFRGTFCSRRPVTITVGAVLTTVGVCFAVMWIPQIIQHLTLAHAMGAICALLFILVFLGGGSFLLYKAAKNQKTVLMITSDGVSYGEKMYRWEYITEIGIMKKYTRRKDLYCTTQLNPFIIELLVTRGLSNEEITKLFAALLNEIAPNHTHVSFCENDDDNSNY